MFVQAVDERRAALLNLRGHLTKLQEHAQPLHEAASREGEGESIDEDTDKLCRLLPTPLYTLFHSALAHKRVFGTSD